MAGSSEYCNVLSEFLPTTEAVGRMTQHQSAPQYRGTIFPAYEFNAQHDAEIIRKATKGIGKEPVATLARLASAWKSSRGAHSFWKLVTFERFMFLLV